MLAFLFGIPYLFCCCKIGLIPKCLSFGGELMFAGNAIVAERATNKFPWFLSGDILYLILIF